MHFRISEAVTIYVKNKNLIIFNPLQIQCI